jgi:hypothetical protein
MANQDSTTDNRALHLAPIGFLVCRGDGMGAGPLFDTFVHLPTLRNRPLGDFPFLRKRGVWRRSDAPLSMSVAKLVALLKELTAGSIRPKDWKSP